MSGDNLERSAWAPKAPNATPIKPASAPISRNVRSMGESYPFRRERNLVAPISVSSQDHPRADHAGHQLGQLKEHDMTARWTRNLGAALFAIATLVPATLAAQAVSPADAKPF